MHGASAFSMAFGTAITARFTPRRAASRLNCATGSSYLELSSSDISSGDYNIFFLAERGGTLVRSHHTTGPFAAARGAENRCLCAIRKRSRDFVLVFPGYDTLHADLHWWVA